ncbi:hypothetical protein [Isoptericola aurantiacus]
MTEPTPDPPPEPDALWDVCPLCFCVVAGLAQHAAAVHPEPDPGTDPEET